MNQPDLGKKIAELRKAKGLTQEELVEETGQVDSIMVQYREDACLLPAPICGKTDIRQYFRSEVKQGYKIMLINTLSVSVADSIAAEKGEWMIRNNSGEEMTGMYLTEWHYSNKKWLIVNDLSGAK
jgi:hypothetical protein